MKKKLGIALAILLCVVLVFTFVACKKDNNVPSEPAGGLAGVDAQQIAEKESALDAYLADWVKAHATEELEDQRTLLQNDLNQVAKIKFKLMGDKAYTPTFSVKYAQDGKYTVTMTYEQGAVTKTHTVNAMTVTYTNWAGQNSRTNAYELYDDPDAIETTLNTISDALVNTVNKVTGNVVTGEFGLDGTVGFDAFGKNYGLRVKGNVNVKDKTKTEVGLVIVNGVTGKEIAGVYYKGAETAKNSRLYFQLLTKDESGAETYTYKYLEYADILGYLEGVLKDGQGNWKVADQAGDGAFAGVNGGFSGLLASFSDKAAEYDSMVVGVVDLLAKAYVQEGEDGTRYLLDINLADVLGQVSDIMSMLPIGDSISILDDLGLDLTTMHGLFGHISISVKVTGDEDAYELSDFELAVNIPEESVLYFTDDESENAKKLDPPSVGFAIYAQDFSFLTTGTVANVIPAEAIRNAESGKGYFSPTNLDMSGDVYVNHVEGQEQGINSTFHFELVTDINPLEVIENGFDSEAKAALIIKQHSGKVTYAAADAAEWSNFLSVSYEQKSKLLCVSGTAFGLEDNGEKVYKFDLYKEVTDGQGNVKQVFDVDKILHWIGIDNWIGLDYNTEDGVFIDDDKKDGNGDPTGPAKPVAKAIFGNELVQELVKYFLNPPADENGSDGDSDEGDASGASVMDDVNAYIDGVKAIYETLVQGGVIAFNADPFSIHVNVDDEAIQTIVDAINSTFGTKDKDGNDIPVISEDDLEAIEDLKIEANSEGYTDKVYVEVEYGDNNYKLLFDGSQEGKFTITFTLTLKSNRTYSVVFDATSGDAEKSWSASVLVDIKDSTGASVNSTEVTLSNFHAEWGNDNSDEVEELIPTAAQKAAASEIFPADERATGVGPATQLVKGILGVLSGDGIKDKVLDYGKMLVDLFRDDIAKLFQNK